MIDPFICMFDNEDSLRSLKVTNLYLSLTAGIYRIRKQLFALNRLTSDRRYVLVCGGQLSLTLQPEHEYDQLGRQDFAAPPLHRHIKGRSGFG